MSNSNDDRGEPMSPAASTPLRRERAPTITIDTSAVIATQDSHENHSSPDHPGPHQHGRRNSDYASSVSSNGITGSPTDIRSRPSFERPISPHNISSPTSKVYDGGPHNFLSVPGTRSRGNSVDSEDVSHSVGSFDGDTYVASSGSAASPPAHQTTANNTDIMNNDDALKPDPGDESDFQVEDNKFAFTPGHLNKLLNPKSLPAFYALGGLQGLEKGLRTNRHVGLSIDEILLDGTVSFEEATTSTSMPTPKTPVRTATMASNAEMKAQSEEAYADRKRVFKDNRLPAKKAKTIWELAWIAYNDKVLILLTVAAIISLALGIYQSITATDGEARVQWVEGVAIIVAILIVVIVGAANDWQKERQFVKLNQKKEDRYVKVIRSGKSAEISVHDLLTGDIMHMEPGDVIPVDGIFIEGHNVKCDESSATGESDLLRKHPGDEVYKAIENHESTAKLDPFIVSGAKVSEGIGTFLVTATGVNSTYGKTLMSLQDEGQTTPLQSKLNILAEYIAKLGLASGLLLFVVLFIKFLATIGHLDGASEKGQAFLQIFIVAVTIIVVAVPEGLPLAVTLALAFATTRMLKDNNLVRLLRACETMGNATTICSDKTGTLTQNKMSVVAGTLGTSSRFGDKHDGMENGGPASQDGQVTNDVSAKECVSTLAAPMKDLLLQSIVMNSTAFEGEEDGVATFIGSKTETALLTFAREHLGMGSVNEERSNSETVQLFPFDSGRKCMGVVVKLPDGRFRMFVKGASEILIRKCTKIVNDPTKDLTEATMTEENTNTLNTIVSAYASRSLRTIGLVYRDFAQWPPRGVPTQEDDRRLAVFDGVFKHMVFMGVVGIQDPLRPGVTESVRIAQQAGVFVRMVTGDNLMTARAIAQECGIFTPGGVAMEGPKFRKLSTHQMNQIIPRLQVLARSSPEDKKILVSALKTLGETVAVTGDGTNDAPALKTADVGFSMGIAGTEVAKEASAIILMDDNFSSIVKAISWGRTVNDAVKKFLQFQITVNITAVILTFVSAVASGDEESVLTAVQLLWVNLIMDTFAALALATDPPAHSVLQRRPEPKSAPLITLTMWKMIIGQAIFQLVVTLILNFAGTSIFNVHGDTDMKELKTLVFNTFVWMQIFNQYNCRRLDNNMNIFEGLFKNRWFLGIQVIIVAGQVMIIFIGGQAFAVQRLGGTQWACSIVLGALSIPMAVIIRLIPDEFLERIIPHIWPRKEAGPQLLVSDVDRRYEWNPALEEIRDQLFFLKAVRGGRLKNIKYKLQHPEMLLPRSRSGSRSRENLSAPQTPVGGDGGEIASPPPASPESRSRVRTRSRSNSAFGPAAAMAGIVAGSIAGWSPVDRGHGEADSIQFSRSRSHSGLDQQQGIEIHPQTRDDDPIINEYDPSNSMPPSQNPDLGPTFEHAPPSAPPSRGRRSTSHNSRQSSVHKSTNSRG